MSMLLEQFDTIFDTPESVDKLKELILDMAVKGKLVPQDPTDEPASVLLEKIKVEKESLIKEKKIKKEKQLSSVAEEDKDYELPIGWSWVKLGQIGQIVGGGTPSTKVAEYFSENEVAWLTPADLNGLKGKYIGSGRRYISKLGLEKSSAQLLPKGSVLFSSRAPIGYVAIASNDLSTNQGFKSCVPYILELNEYLYYYLKHIAKKVDEKASGTTFKEVSGKIVSNLSLALPPLDEQKRIVKKVDQLMSFCEELKNRLEKKQKREERLNVSVFSSLEQSLTVEELKGSLQFVLTNLPSLCTDRKQVQQLRNAIVSLAVKGILVLQDSDDEPARVFLDKIKQEKEQLIQEKKIKKEKAFLPISEENKPYKLPKGWEWVRLGELCTLIELGTSVKASTENIGVPVLRMNNIKNGKVVLSNLKYLDKNSKDLPRLYLRYGDLLFNRTNSYELVGKTGVFKGIDDEFTFASYLIRLRLMEKYVDNGYVNYVINSNWYRISQIEPGIVQQNGQANFNGTKLKNTLIPLPPLNEQKRIVKRIDQLMTLCDELENNINVFKQEKEYLLHSVLYQIF